MDLAPTGLRWAAPRGPARGAMRASLGLTAAAWAGVVAASIASLGGLAVWALMLVAMMLPGALPAVRHVAANSLCWRRGRAVALFLMAYGAVWLVVGGALLAAATVAATRAPAAVLAGALVVAAGWQLTVFKRRAVRDCHRSTPLPPSGWPATRGVVRFGAVYGGACVRSCWALMAVMAVASSWMVVWMLALTVAASVEKLAVKPRRTTRTLAGALGVAALAAATVPAAGLGDTTSGGAMAGEHAHGPSLLCRIR